ncbi:Polyprenyl synthetase family protein [Brugia malayi]|uniref:Farnesyl pyrophosphate synthase n=3 Tax=Brugia malayi TaxID=6279 RepID=A0A158Q086_BRUMA|nr:Polyprenyl synthetase family protein [Brugia malayi]CDQ04160.1 BMA-FDPS-1, isoform b [Brugia malayi]VIO95596.1 Polyprenyl synthetase family protein [Brugia malayi]
MCRKQIVDAIEGIKRIAMQKFVTSLQERETKCIRDRIDKLFDHSVCGGKYKRSILLVEAYKALGGRQDEERMKMVTNIAACLELLQSFFLIEDDVMDEGVNRRGKPCWHRLEGIGINGINDGLLLDCMVSYILRSNRVSADVRDAFDEARRVTILGQILDGDTKSVEDCTWQRHRSITQHKTSHYTYFTPLQIAALLTAQPLIIEPVKRIAYLLGYLFQSKDDYMDCFGDKSITGKVGNDLREAKCTWVTCKAMEKLTHQPSFLTDFQEHFGKRSITSEQKLKDILTHLRVADDFHLFRERYAGEILNSIDHFPMIDLRPVLRQSVNDLVDANL